MRSLRMTCPVLLARTSIAFNTQSRPASEASTYVLRHNRYSNGMSRRLLFRQRQQRPQSTKFPLHHFIASDPTKRARLLVTRGLALVNKLIVRTIRLTSLTH